jgi:plastocyanin
VTFGTKVDTMLGTVLPLLDKFEGVPEEQIPKEAIDTFESATESLPFMFSDDGPNDLNQTAAQSCYLKSGDLRTDKKPCAKQELPAFDGTPAYYNSGFIPYEGQNGNTFTMKLADDIKPGKYQYYCAVHGPQQNGTVDVKAAETKIPSQAEVNIEARKAINKEAAALLKTYRQTKKTGTFAAEGETYKAPFAGLYDAKVEHAAINEFVPRTIKLKVGEKTTWTLLGPPHTVSFNVPAYFPIATVEKDGTVKINEKLDAPAGGSPPVPERSHEDGPSPPVNIEAGAWNGEGFYSSGSLGGGSPATYTMSFAKPGTYKLACLFHPPMVGTVEVVA